MWINHSTEGCWLLSVNANYSLLVTFDFSMTMQIKTLMEDIKTCRKLRELICVVISCLNLLEEIFSLLLIHSIICSHINFYLSRPFATQYELLSVFLLVCRRHPMNMWKWYFLRHKGKWNKALSYKLTHHHVNHTNIWFYPSRTIGSYL